MIKYITDKELKYKEFIKNNLRAYNLQFAGKKDEDKQNFYVIENGILVGGVSTELSWDRGYMGNLYYSNLEVLKSMLVEINSYYDDRYTGINDSSNDPVRVNDLKFCGFKVLGKLNDMPKGKIMNHMEITDFDNLSSSYEVLKTKEVIKEYDDLLKEKQEIRNASLNVSNEEEEINFIALEGDTFVGGVNGYIKNDYLNIRLLLVSEDHRGMKIGNELMKLIEEFGKEEGITNFCLGTAEFQARPFYEKLGYEVVVTYDDFPKGYQLYTLYKGI